LWVDVSMNPRRGRMARQPELLKALSNPVNGWASVVEGARWRPSHSEVAVARDCRIGQAIGCARAPGHVAGVFSMKQKSLAGQGAPWPRSASGQARERACLRRFPPTIGCTYAVGTRSQLRDQLRRRSANCRGLYCRLRRTTTQTRLDTRPPGDLESDPAALFSRQYPRWDAGDVPLRQERAPTTTRQSRSAPPAASITLPWNRGVRELPLTY